MLQCALNPHSIWIQTLESSQLYLLQCSNDSRTPRHTQGSATQRSADFVMSCNNFLKVQPYNIPTADSTYRSWEFKALLQALARNWIYLGNIRHSSHGHVTKSNRVKPGFRSHDRVQKSVLHTVFKLALGVTTHCFSCFSGDLQHRSQCSIFLLFHLARRAPLDLSICICLRATIFNSHVHLRNRVPEKGQTRVNRVEPMFDLCMWMQYQGQTQVQLTFDLC